MITLKQILLPTDFSDNASVAVNYACALAEQFDAQLHLLHVIEHYIPTFPLYGVDTGPPENLEELKKAAEKKLPELLDAKWREGKDLVCATLLGRPFLEIIYYAKRNDIDLIVMGTHGRSGLAHAIIGSVAERVVRKAPCPVLTVRPEGHQFVMP